MTTSQENNGISPSVSSDQEFSLERIDRLIADLERELANAPENTPNLQDLRGEIDTLKHVLKSSREKQGSIEEGLHSIRLRLQNMTATIEGEVLKDSPYIVEIGRILGMV